jgi:hypothetical protein
MKHKVFDKDFNLVEIDCHPDDHLDIHPQIRRLKTYDIAEQLNLLYDDIRDGKLGEAAKTGKFYAYISEIKQRYPKV